MAAGWLARTGWIIGFSALVLGGSPPARAEDFLAYAASIPVVSHPEPDYHFAGDVWAAIALLVRERPGVVRPFLVGRATTGRPIWGFRVADPAWPVDVPRRKLLVFANIHSLEWVPTEDALALLLDAARQPPPGVELTVIPILNPDGRDRVEKDLIAGRNAYRRGNQAQVDLNRDFAVNRDARAIWAPLLPSRFSTSAAPLSQPESQALDALAAAERFDVAVSLHAFGGYFYYPWTGRWERPADWHTFDALGERMQRAMGPYAYKPRQLSRWGFFFRAQGTEIDHLYGRYGTLAFLVETTRTGLTLAHPADRKRVFRWYNPRDPRPHVRRGLGMLRELAHAVGEPGFVPAVRPGDAG